MSTLATPAFATVSDLLEQLGDIPPARVRMHPLPGTATLRDLIESRDRDGRVCELVDGVLVEKRMGFRESALAGVIIGLLRSFVVPRNLGIVVAPDAMMQLTPGLVRAPDVSYIAWNKLPGGVFPVEPVPNLAPDLAVEIISAGNTPREMARKRREYFMSGVRLVWIVDPWARTVAIYRTPTNFQLFSESESLDGGEVLPGLSIHASDIFSELDRTGDKGERT